MTAQGKAALLELRDRLGKATGPDRAIDQELFEILGLCKSERDGTLALYRAPDYTASLDAAVTLVPAEYAETWCVRPRAAWLHSDTGIYNAATPALALCLTRIEYELAKEGRS